MNMTNVLFSLEGPIGVGKSTILSALQRRGYKVFPEPVHKWIPAINNFYQVKYDGTKEEMVDAAIRLQNVVIDSLIDRHEEILKLPQTGEPIIMERSIYAALCVFADINARIYPNQEKWGEINKSMWEYTKLYEPDSKRIGLHHDKVDELISRTRVRQGVDQFAKQAYLTEVYEQSLLFESECTHIINVTGQNVDETVDHIINNIFTVV